MLTVKLEEKGIPEKEYYEIETKKGYSMCCVFICENPVHSGLLHSLNKDNLAFEGEISQLFIH